MTYTVTRARKGHGKIKALWQARRADYPQSCGSGARPELAIRDCDEQVRRWKRSEARTEKRSQVKRIQAKVEDYLNPAIAARIMAE